MNGPYFNTILRTTITLHPNQMNNDLYRHLKDNLVTKLQNKCFGPYGHITKIYNIEERNEGMIIPEDPMGSVVYNVKFSCKLCRPLKGNYIICEVTKINKALILLRNGPVYILILENKSQKNQENFYFDEKKNMLIGRIDETRGEPVVKGTFIKLKIIDTKIEDKSDKIYALATMESIATPDEIQSSVELREKDDLQYTTYDEYVKSEKTMDEESKDEKTVDLESEAETENKDSMSSKSEESEEEISD